MGYCISLCEAKFNIKAANKAAALEAIRALAHDTASMTGGSWGSGGQRTSRHYSWVTTDEFFLAKTLEVAFEAWRWELHTDEASGDVVGISFQGEKLGDDQKLLDAVAPFVENGSYLQMSGEDGTVWRWVFKDGDCFEVQPSWPSE